jgi:two-component system phosphate regulon sensor histidine kinase PhoR
VEFVVEAIILLALSGFVVWLLKRQLDLARSRVRQSQREVNRAGEELKRQRAQCAAITQNLAEGVLLVDARQRVIFLNKAAQELLKVQDGIGRELGEIAWGWDLQPLVKEVLAQKAESLTQLIVRDDRAFQARVCALPTSTPADALIILSEATELQRLGRIRRDLVANVSHELRTPITTLNLLAETLSNELPADASMARDLLAKLRGQIDLLHQLTTEMMDLSMIESGQMPIKLVDTGVAELVEEALTLLRPQAERKPLTLIIQIPLELRVLADAAAVRKVVSNLVHNDIKFTPPQGTITVQAQREGDNVQVRVADTGIGIPARDLPRIFERFYKVDRARTSGESRGTGLGLAIAKHIVEGHGGKIWAESVEGKGSTFYFTLPATV